MTTPTMCGLVAALLLLPDPPAAAQPGGHRQLPLAAPGEVAEGMAIRTCTDAPRICLQLEPPADGRLVASLDLGAEAPAASRAPLELGAVADDEEVAPWLSVVVEAGGAIIFGVERARRTGYSGGGMVVHRLVLHRLDPATGAAAELLDVPIAGAASIRACFDEDDVQRRRGQCLDEYDFDATLDLIPPRYGEGDQPEAGGGAGTATNYGRADAAGRPRFVYVSRATTYPGRRSRSEDSTEAPPLRPADLVQWTDPACTYRRTFAWDAAAGRYLPDAPLPACGDYLDF